MTKDRRKGSAMNEIFFDFFQHFLRTPPKGGSRAQHSVIIERTIVMEAKKEKRVSPVAGKKEIQAFHTAVMRGEVQDYVLEGKGKEAVPVAVPASLKMRMEAAEKLEAYHALQGKSRSGMDTAEVVRLMREMEGE